MRVTATITHEGDWFIARCLEAEVTNQGESAEVALTNLQKALELYFDDAQVIEIMPTLEQLLSKITDENKHNEVNFGEAQGSEKW